MQIQLTCNANTVEIRNKYCIWNTVDIKYESKIKEKEEGPHVAGGWWYKYNTNSIKIQHKNSKSKI